MIDTSLSRRAIFGVPETMQTRPKDLLFFDNMALYYVMTETPQAVLARVFNSSDARLAGSFLGLLTPSQRETIHALMAAENDGDEEKNRAALQALLIVADGIRNRGLIEKKGVHFFGKPKEEDAN